MQPVVCNKDMAVVFPLKDGDCEFWLEIVDSVDDITNPSRDHAYVDSKGLFYIYNGKEIQVINDHANLKIKWGNMIGDISNQLDLIEILNQFVKTISVNGTNIAKDNDKNIAIQVPITTIKLDGNTISPVDYIVNLDLASVYAKKTEIPKNVSELQNDAGYIKQEVVDQLIPIKAIKVNNVTIPPDENHAVNIKNVYVTPEEFGAVGDGVTDDSAAFNRCFTDANNSGKYVLLGNGLYLIANKLNNITDIHVYGPYGVKPAIKLNDNVLTDTALNCYFYNIHFLRDVRSSKSLIGNFNDSQFEKCKFENINYLFNDILTETNMSEHVLLNNCELNNSQLISVSHTTHSTNVYIINNTLFYYDGTGSQLTFIISGYVGCKLIFNNCTFNKNYEDNPIELFSSVDDFEFNNCFISQHDSANTFFIPNISDILSQKITFNGCDITNNNKTLVTISNTNKDVFSSISIKDSSLYFVNAFFNTTNECSLWLENNRISVKPTINVGTGKVNIVEIQQKNVDTSENIFPWVSEIPTVENNVSLNKIGTDQYYVLTESKDKNVKKLDYYFKYNFDYLPTAPYYTNNVIVRDLDLEGYTVKRSFLSNNTCKLKNKSTGELIDYVYLMLDDNVTVTTEKNDPQFVYTTIAMKYLPYFAKLKTDTPVAGHLYVDACISIILEKTSS